MLSGVTHSAGCAMMSTKMLLSAAYMPLHVL